MWILDNGIWLDLGVWDDTDFWQDYPVVGVILAADGGTYELTGTPATLLIAPAEVPVIGGDSGLWRPPRPHPVEGTGYGILPPLKGAAFGVVGIAGRGAVPLPALDGFAIGTAGISGRSIARLAVKAAGHGGCGNAGTGVGHIDKFKAVGIAHHDDDEAVAIGFLLDA